MDQPLAFWTLGSIPSGLSHGRVCISHPCIGAIFPGAFTFLTEGHPNPRFQREGRVKEKSLLMRMDSYQGEVTPDELSLGDTCSGAAVGNSALKTPA